jgi:hypothetical protein
MKSKRVVLIFDEEFQLPALRLLLQTRGHKVLSCTREAQRETLMSFSQVDLLLVGPRIECLYVGEVPTIERLAYWSAAELVERIRIALIRKRGPKKPSAALTEYQQGQVRKAAS